MLLSDDQKLSFLSNISNKLSESHNISSYEYELFNLIKREEKNSFEINFAKKIGEENNSNEEKIENRMTKEKIKTNIEKIISYIKDKKDYEFISDFFITESTQSPILEENIIVINNKNSGNIELDEINEDFLNNFSKSNLSDINSIIEFNKKIKKNNISELDEQFDLNLINTKKKTSKEDLILDDIKKSESFKRTKSGENNLKNKEATEEETKEEITRQIFGFTRRMKESARSSGAQLKKDNRASSEIENSQDVVQDKTTKEASRLNEFNYSIKLGPRKLITMNTMVFGTFFATLLIIKIFPKLAHTKQ